MCVYVVGGGHLHTIYKLRSEVVIKQLSKNLKSFDSWKAQFSDLFNIYQPKMISLQRIIFPPLLTANLIMSCRHIASCHKSSLLIHSDKCERCADKRSCRAKMENGFTPVLAFDCLQHFRGNDSHSNIKILKSILPYFLQ